MRWFFAALLAWVPLAHAEPWLCTEPGGNKQFSYDPQSAKRKECVHHPIPSPNVWRANPAPRTDDGGTAFPRVDARIQKQRDAARRELLERELAEERRSLAEAMKELSQHKELHAREKDRARVEAGLKIYENRIRVHLTNIANLEKELGREG